MPAFQADENVVWSLAQVWVGIKSRRLGFRLLSWQAIDFAIIVVISGID